MNIKKEIELLIEKIKLWDNEYFNLDKPTVSDKIYDSTLRKLAKLEMQYPEYINPNSPTKRVGSNIVNKFKKIIHERKMLSLDKAYSHKEVLKFYNDVLKKTDEEKINFYLEPKIDGLSISLQYKDQKLVRAITRGDGDTGEDVTDNVFDIIKDIPTHIKYQGDIEVRGEIFIKKSVFKQLQNDNIKFANPRNMASGTLRQINKEVVRERDLSCFVYELVSPESHQINEFDKSILFLKENGFKVLEKHLLTNNINEIFSYIDKFEIERNLLDYETDGLVIKINDINYYSKLGFTSKFPKYNIAYKFNDELVETKLQNITLTIGRTGMVTYNAELEPISLKGTIVVAATLHNFNYIKKLNINIGDYVMIKKAGEIIPKVFSLSKKNSDGEFKKIIICPYCKNDLVDNELNTDQFCLNNDCPEINIRKIIHFVSRKAMDISGLGESWVRIFYDLNIIKKSSDIYLLNQKINQIKDIPRIGEKSLNNLLTSIEISKNKNLPSLLFALGINHLGERNCKLVASEIKSFSNFLSFNFTKLEQIPDIGPITVKSIIEFQNNHKNIIELEQLISSGVNPIYQENKQSNNPFFKNKTFAITGKFNISRDKIKNIIEDNGGKFSTTVSAKTDYLMCGSDFGSKKEKAISLGVEIIYENFFKKWFY